MHGRLASEYKRHSAEALEDPEKYLSNPVIAFLMMKRFTVDWQNILETFLNVSHADGTSSDGTVSSVDDDDDLANYNSNQLKAGSHSPPPVSYTHLTLPTILRV